MQNLLDEILKKESEILVLEWALLPSVNKYWNQCDVKILIKADDVERKNKVMQRDNITESYFIKREASSIDYSQFSFDYIFENDYQIETIEKIINQIEKE